MFFDEGAEADFERHSKHAILKLCRNRVGSYQAGTLT